MKVRKLFWEDRYLKECEATITSVNGNIITVDQTVFYAFAGGQQSDSGTIGDYEVIEALKEDSQIYYTLPDHNLKVGDQVKITIDFEKRYSIMKQHTLAEIAGHLFMAKCPDAKIIGSSVNVDKSRIDFNWERNVNEIIPELTTEIKEIINKDLEVKCGFLDEEQGIRYWEVEGIGNFHCGGTHVNRTGELGEFVLKRVNLGKDKERIDCIIID